MPRAVLDSSVLVAAFLTPHGSVVRLLRAPLRLRYELYLSDVILTETADVLIGKSRLRRQYQSYADADVHAYLRWLVDEAQLVDDVPILRVVAADPKDDPIVATAIAAQANYLVTGDRAHLLPIGEYQGVRIVSPRDFIGVLDRV